MSLISVGPKALVLSDRPGRLCGTLQTRCLTSKWSWPVAKGAGGRGSNFQESQLNQRKSPRLLGLQVPQPELLELVSDLGCGEPQGSVGLGRSFVFRLETCSDLEI